MMMRRSPSGSSRCCVPPVRCNNARSTNAWRTERTVRCAGRPSERRAPCSPRASADVSAAERERDTRRKRVFHFDPHLKRMTTLDEEPGGGCYHAPKRPIGCSSAARRFGARTANICSPTPTARRCGPHLSATRLRAYVSSASLSGASLGRDGRRRRLIRGPPHLHRGSLHSLDPACRGRRRGDACRRAGIRIIVVTGGLS